MDGQEADRPSGKSYKRGNLLGGKSNKETLCNKLKYKKTLKDELIQEVKKLDGG